MSGMLEYSGDTRSGIVGYPRNTIGSFYATGSTGWVNYSGGTHINAFNTIPNTDGERGPGLNIGACWNTSTHKYTAPTTGMYIFEGRFYTFHGNNYISTGLRLNGSGSVMAHQGDGIVANYNASDSTRDNVVYQQMRIRLNAGDYVQLHAIGLADIHGQLSGWGGYLWKPEVHNTAG